jgi:hypothetical protein
VVLPGKGGMDDTVDVKQIDELEKKSE